MQMSERRVVPPHIDTENTKKFTELFNGLEDCTEVEQKQKIREMNEEMEEMKKIEIESILTEELFDKILKMTDEKKLNFGNAIVLLKHAGYCITLKRIFIQSFEKSSLNKKIEELIINENEKKEGKDEKLLVDICECYLLLNSKKIPDELVSIIVPCLLKVATNKEENEETQKEVEMALLSLYSIGELHIEKELYFNEIKEIVKYHQEHHNLTRLAYQDAWGFLIDRYFCEICSKDNAMDEMDYESYESYESEESLEDIVVNDQNFAREAARELEELARKVDWKKKKEEEREKEVKEVNIIWRWTSSIQTYILYCRPRCKECDWLFGSISRLIRASRENHKDICKRYICLLENSSENEELRIDAFTNVCVTCAVLEEIQQPTMDETQMWSSLNYFSHVFERLTKMVFSYGKKKVKELKRKVFDKLEEEGYEDTITSLYDMFYYHNRYAYFGQTKNISDFIINV